MNRAILGLAALAVAVGSSASCGGAVSNKEYGDGGDIDAASSSSSGGSGSGSGLDSSSGSTSSSGTDSGYTSGSGGGSGGCIVGHPDDWDEWPIPNSQADVAAGAPNLESYRDNGDGTATDLVTCLMWQQVVPSMKYSSTDALGYCAGLMLAGRSDWRLPSEAELFSIVDFGQQSPSISATAFPSAPANWFWSSTLVAGTTDVWSVNFGYGYANYKVEAYTPSVRCVRSTGVDGPAGHYTIGAGASAGTVYDTKSKLTWQQAAPVTAYPWANAKTYCTALDLDGGGWRMPTEKELFSLVDRSGQMAPPTIDSTAFPGTPPSYFWSSTLAASSASYAWSVDFSTGQTYDFDMSPVGNVRCVR